jgi:hypothetical protein
MSERTERKRPGKIEWIKVSAVVHSTEDREKVGLAMATLFPFEFEILRSRAKGHYGNPIEYLEVEIKKKREIKEFWEYLINMLGDQKEELLATVEDRLDNQNVLHIRFDKQRAYLGELKLGSGEGDAIVVKAKLVTYPSRRDKVVEMLKELICTTF